MQKTTLRPLRLVHLLSDHLHNGIGEVEQNAVEEVKEQLGETVVALTPLTLPEYAADVPAIPLGEVGARQLLKRTPASYLLNQAYGLWFFVSYFFLTVIITHKLSNVQYGVFAVAQAAFNTIAYIVALGLEDATTTYVPRVLAEHGQAAAALLIRRLLVLRIIILGASFVVMLFALPILATFIAALPITGLAGVAAGLRDPTVLSHITPIAVNVLGNGIGGLLTAVCAARMRMRLVFVVGSIIQLLELGLCYLVLQLGFGVNGVLWLLAIASVVSALAFAAWQLPFLLTRGATYRQPLKPVIRLGISAWLTNLVSGALLKQVSIILLTYFVVSLVQIGYFNLSFQLGHAASLLLVSGFGGVGASALAAAFVGQNYDRLARSWQALIKIETLLSAPLLVFCLFNAQNIAPAMYGSNFDPVGPLLTIFLFFNVLIRISGTTIHQSTLYVLNKPRLVVLAQWIGLVVVAALGIALIPRWGPAGALIADGTSQAVTGALLLAFLWRDLPKKYPLGFTLRLLAGLALAALPSLLWRPTSRVLLGVSGGIFLALSIGILLLIRPLSAEDLETIAGLNPRMATYLRRFARGK